MARGEHKKTNPIQIEKYLKGVDYPASKDDLVRHAQEQKAPAKVIETLQALPEEDYNGPTDVAKAWKEAA